MYPPARGVGQLPPWPAGTWPLSVRNMDDPQIQITATDLERLLAEAEREDRLLAGPYEESEAPREALDSQILAGLVSP